MLAEGNRLEELSDEIQDESTMTALIKPTWALMENQRNRVQG